MSTIKALRVHVCGDAEAIRIDDLPMPTLSMNEVLVEVKAVGVNFMDTQIRSGLFKKDLPTTLGIEGAGVIKALGPGTTDLAIGDRVAWIFGTGSYTTHAVVPTRWLAPIPDGLTFDDAAAVMFQGLTAHYLARSAFPLKSGDVCLVHSAAGGCGLLLCQIAKISGARVIGAVSTRAKADLARRAGADEVVVYGEQDFSVAAKSLTGGRGVDVVFDAVGLDTYEKSMDSLKTRGVLVLYGEASGLVPPLDVRQLVAKGSLYLTRTGLHSYVESRSELLERAGELFNWMKQKKLKCKIFRVYPLDQAAKAHRDIEGRGTMGKLLLHP